MKTASRCPLVFASAVVSLVIAGSQAWAQDQSNPIVVKAIQHVVTPPLRLMAPIPPQASPAFAEEDREFTRDRTEPRVPLADTALQASSALSTSRSLSTTTGLDFLGLGNGFPGYSIQDIIPSTNGAAGTTQYVQFVNNSFAVFNKSNGSLVYGPANMNTLWQSLGAPCSTNANMDGIAQFDKLANVWVMLMPIYPDPTYLCIAVSTSSNATGSWNLYAFELPQSKLCGCRLMPDYPKLAVWPDAYYISYHQALDLNYEGPAACAVNRAAMLAGTAATMQCFFNTGASKNAWLPSDLDGTTPPPTGTPNYYVAFDPNDQSLDVWQFHVDWSTPSNSTLTGPTNIPVAAFLEPCGDGVTIFTPMDNCVPQAGTSQMLGAFGDELMYRVAYRNFGSYQALVANHTVQVGTGSNQTGLRWYELQNNGSGFALYQQGTYAPDSNYRWMGSIAMDQAGDIAMGYNVSGSSMNPSIRYTGRLASDPLGTMETENDVLSTAGVKTGSLTSTYRWGDYSSLAVDPGDDCTFWYTTEYIPPNTNHWATRINSFKFPSCGSNGTTAWNLVNKTSNYANPLTSLTIPATGSGNLIAIALMFNGTTSVASMTDNAGNTYVSAGAHSVRGILSTEVWYAVNSKSGATSVTPTFVGSPTHVEMSEWEVSGLSTPALDAVNTATGSVTSNNTAGPAVTTSQAGDFVVSVFFANQANITGMSSGNSFTDDFTTQGNGWAHLTSNSAPAGSQQASWYTPSPIGIYCSSTVAFLP
jgi:hypothetical protein